MQAKSAQPSGEANLVLIAALLLAYNLCKVARSGAPCTEHKLGFQTMAEFAALNT